MLFHRPIAIIPDMSPERRDPGLRAPGMKHAFDGRWPTID